MHVDKTQSEHVFQMDLSEFSGNVLQLTWCLAISNIYVHVFSSSTGIVVQYSKKKKLAKVYQIICNLIEPDLNLKSLRRSSRAQEEGPCATDSRKAGWMGWTPDEPV